MDRFVLSVLVENKAGVLSRVSGLFSRRGYNIDSLTVCETHNPNQAVEHHEYGIRNKIYRKRFVRLPPKPSTRNVDDHKSEATKSSDLLYECHIFIIPFVVKAIFALYCKKYIGYHND